MTRRYLFWLLLLAFPVHAATLVFTCPDPTADGRPMDNSPAGWPNCPGSVYAAPSRSLIVATLAGNPATTTWVLASKLTSESIWTQTDGVAPGAWAKASALTWDATTTPTPPDGPLIKVAPASLTFSWTAPTANKDGTPLIDLAGYRLYSHVDGSPFGEFMQIANPAATSYVLDAVAATNIFYSMTAYNKAGIESAMSGSVNVLVNPAPAINCAVSAFSAWTDTSAWSACAASSQSKTQQHARTITTQPANGGTACPALTETQTISQACAMPVTWTVAGTGLKWVYELIRNWNNSGWAQGGALGQINGGKPCDSAVVWPANSWHRVSQSDMASLVSITYQGRQGIVQCVAK